MKKIRNSKRKLEKNLAYSEDKNNRKFARYIKSKTKSKTAIGPLITREKKMLTDDKDMAEELNTFFASVFTKEDLQMIPEAEKEHVEVAMGPVVVTQQMIRKQIGKLRKEVATGPDEITPGLLKMMEEVLLLLEIIFNESLTTGTVRVEDSKCHTNLQKRNKRGPWQLSSSFTHKRALQNVGIHRERQNDEPSA